MPAQTVESDMAFAPYGEVYNKFGSSGIRQVMFTGDTEDVLSGIFNAPNRELAASNQGRWLSPDPAGSGWNQYAYSTNPNSFGDPTGLDAESPSQISWNDYDPFNSVAPFCGLLPCSEWQGVVAADDTSTASTGQQTISDTTTWTQSGSTDDGSQWLSTDGGQTYDAGSPVNVPFDPQNSVTVNGDSPDSVPTITVDELSTAQPLLIAQNYPPGMNGAMQAAKQAAKGTPKQTPPPPLSPGNEPPPTFPDDFQSDWTKLLKAWMDNFPFFDIIITAPPCFSNPSIPCEGPPEI